MLANAGAILAIIASAIVIIGATIAVAKGGLKVFGRIGKIENIDKAVNALLFIHRDELFKLYKDQIRLVFNPSSEPYSEQEKDSLLAKLHSGFLTREDSPRLIEILKYEESEAKRKDNQIAVLVIGALLLLIALASKKS